MYAESYYKESPKFNLDQTETVKAIDAYQVFINQYPSSSRVADCNNKIDELREKLEAKALKAADLYYRTQNYRAAAFSYKNLLIDYPDIDNPEDIQFKIVKSFYKYAEQSIVSKQQERYEESIKVANTFLARYKNSQFKPIIEETRELAHLNAIKSAYTYALINNLDKRDKKLNEVYEVIDVHNASITDQKLKAETEKVKEEIAFHLIKTHFLQAQNIDVENKRDNFYKNHSCLQQFYAILRR
ncbi:MAG: outer membrane protein assembly factor BamD [Chitinophagales bacterium]|nr:outer membrane protein assembly factor BamD [Chitinophagales bacterium]